MNIMCTHYFILRVFSFVSKRIFSGYDIWHADGFLKAILVTTAILVIEILIVKILKALKISNSYIMRV